jgi:cytochrome c553
MIKANIAPAIVVLREAVAAKSSTKFMVAFDNLTGACNTCHAGAGKPFIRIQRPTAPPLSNQNFAPVN